KQPNELDIYDMSGNVWEWRQDWYGYYPSGSAMDPAGSSGGSHRVDRGGSWDFYARHCRSADRNGNVPGRRGNNLGFRLAGRIE
ncbi:MAG: SUMF1/EgtB/PvdO family nonheme iron enzyme, partial [Deltaproteobacteria bacterium]|nr:SUMF1/EgtB/PvdO family nonheme iron enzyme [Deltaproteobacteria bacterium]